MAAASVAATDTRIALGAPSPSLGAIAAKNGRLFGAAAAEVIDSDAAYRDLYVTQTKVITTDVAKAFQGEPVQQALTDAAHQIDGLLK